MEITLNKQTAPECETILDSTYEHPFELDCTLPDYCRDIMKILCTNVNPVIIGSSINGNKLTIDGNSIVCIYYCDAENNISKYESKIPFSKIIELKSSPNNPIIYTNCTEGYVNCRAVSPRRLDIRGTISIGIKITNCIKKQVTNEIDYPKMESKTILFDGVEGLGQFSKQFTIKETLNLINQNEIPQNILSYDICPKITEKKLLPGKVIIKGNMYLHLLYCCEKTNEVKVCDYNIQFSQIIDCSQADEDTICDICLKTVNSEILCQQNENNEYVFNLSATICANVNCYKEITVKAIGDCYCRRYQCNCKSKTINLTKIIQNVNDVHTQKETLELPTDTTDIIDAKCRYISQSVSSDENKVILQIRAIISALVMSDKHYMCVEKPITINHEIAIKGTTTNVSFNPCISIGKCEYSSINNSKTEIGCEINIAGIIFDTICCNVIDNVVVDEKSAKKVENDKVIVYYPKTRESLWDIAKKYNTSIEQLRAENNIEEDYVEPDGFILITIRRFFF